MAHPRSKQSKYCGVSQRKGSENTTGGREHWQCNCSFIQPVTSVPGPRQLPQLAMAKTRHLQIFLVEYNSNFPVSRECRNHTNEQEKILHLLMKNVAKNTLHHRFLYKLYLCYALSLLQNVQDMDYLEPPNCLQSLALLPIEPVLIHSQFLL